MSYKLSDILGVNVVCFPLGQIETISQSDTSLVPCLSACLPSSPLHFYNIIISKPPLTSTLASVASLTFWSDEYDDLTLRTGDWKL